MNNENVLQFYYTAYNIIINSEYESEIDYIDSLKPIGKQDAHTFFLEYVWVVINAGMKEQIARNIYNRYCENFDISVIRHQSKHDAIKYMMNNYSIKFSELINANDKIEYLQTLPWIGQITKYHLARNIGIDTVKPDRHLVRLAEMFKFESPMKMCNYIKNDNGTKLGTIDVVLWRYCNLNRDYQR
jgi:hypothetical protein